MAARKPAAKKAGKKASAKKAASKAKTPARKAAPKTAGVLRVTRKPAAKPREATAPAAPARAKATSAGARARRPAGSPPVEKTRVVIALDVYEPRKDAFKAPFKEHEMKWNFLGEGKGLYKRADGGVHCFTQFKDDGVHYSLWGGQKDRVEGILAVWRSLLGEAGWAKATASGEQAVAKEQAVQESEALKLWRLGEPQRRPGEPDLFFQKRVAEWNAKRPA